MKREILFRGKNNGEWTQGYLFRHPDGTPSIFDPGTGSLIVQEETIGQYTGLLDINQVKIFEGAETYHHAHKTKCKIVYHEDHCCFCGVTEEGDCYYYQAIDQKYLEVTNYTHSVK